MRFTRFSLISAAAVLASAALSVTPAMAASQVNIPFSFVASGKSFPAGQYVVDKDGNGGFLTMRGDKANIFSICIQADPVPGGKKAVVTFDHIGETYLLRSFQYGSQTTLRLDSKARDLKAAEERKIEGGL